MVKRIASVFLIGLFVLILSAMVLEAQNIPELKTETSPEPELLWVWGEVVSVDAALKKLTVIYLDYETDQDRELAIGIDERTEFENVKSLEDIKPKDYVSIDYIANPEGITIARMIGVEKIEEPDNPAGDPNQNLEGQEGKK